MRSGNEIKHFSANKACGDKTRNIRRQQSRLRLGHPSHSVQDIEDCTGCSGAEPHARSRHLRWRLKQTLFAGHGGSIEPHPDSGSEAPGRPADNGSESWTPHSLKGQASHMKASHEMAFLGSEPRRAFSRLMDWSKIQQILEFRRPYPVSRETKNDRQNDSIQP